MEESLGDREWGWLIEHYSLWGWYLLVWYHWESEINSVL